VHPKERNRSYSLTGDTPNDNTNNKQQQNDGISNVTSSTESGETVKSQMVRLDSLMRIGSRASVPAVTTTELASLSSSVTHISDPSTPTVIPASPRRKGTGNSAENPSVVISTLTSAAPSSKGEGGGEGDGKVKELSQNRQKRLSLLMASGGISKAFYKEKNFQASAKWNEVTLSPEEKAKLTRLQARIRGWHARRLKKRLMIAREILVTEDHYIKILKLIVTVFLRPALAQKNLIDPLDVHAIFSDVEVIYQHHQKWYVSLERRVTDWEQFAEKGIGDIVTNESDFLLLYTTYVNNYNNAIATLARCLQTSSQFTAFVKKGEERPECAYLDLQSLLIQPIQRIPRYEMLLLDMLRKTSKGHKSYRSLVQAVDKIKETAEYINERKREEENLEFMAKLEKQFIGKLAKDLKLCQNPQRRFIKEGSVVLRAGKASTEMHLFLFNDLLLVAKAKEGREGRRGRPRRETEMRKNTFAAAPTDNTIFSLKDIDSLSNFKNVGVVMDSELPCFQVVMLKKKFVFVVGTEKMRDVWIDALRNAWINFQKQAQEKRQNQKIKASNFLSSEVPTRGTVLPKNDSAE